MICQQCGTENSDSCRFCVGCGAELTAPVLKKVRKLPLWPLAALLLLAAALALYFILR